MSAGREAKPDRLTSRYWTFGYSAFALILSLLAMLRVLWSWPDAAWQSTLWYIEDVDRILNQGISISSFWIGLGSELATTGYRWFQYANAALFGFDMRLEIVVYYSLALVLSLALGLRALRHLERMGSSPWARATVFAIPPLLATMVGAGSRGMELGQFFGITALVLIAFLIDSPRITTRWFVVVAWIAAPLLTVLTLGGYAGGALLALVAISVLQFVRPTTVREARRRLTHLTLALGTSVIFWASSIALLGTRGDGGDADLTGLWQQVQGDWLFLPKYVLAGLGSSVINAYTLEQAGGRGALAYTIGLLVAGFITLAIVLGYKRAWEGATVPLIIILMGPGLALIVVLGRSFGALWLMSPWYGFHFHLMLAGAVWLFTRAMAAPKALTSTPRQRTWPIPLTASLLVALMGLLAWANVLQWERQPNERAYFQRVQQATLLPSSLRAESSGLTQLVLPLDTSRRAIEILERNRLSVYRDPVATLESLPAPNSIGDGVITIGVDPDGWAGSAIALLVEGKACARLDIQLVPFPGTPGGAGITHPASRVRITPNFGPPSTVVLRRSPRALQFKPAGPSPRIDLVFSRTWQPSVLGVGQDERSLSASVRAACA